MNSGEVVKKYYGAFNRKDWQTFFDLVDESVRHDVNQGKPRHGKSLFREFMDHMNRCYDEQVVDLVVLTSTENPTRVGAEFVIQGKYLATDSGLPPAKGQTYSIPVGAFLEIKNGKVDRVTTYYNLKDWIDQVSK